MSCYLPTESQEHYLSSDSLEAKPETLFQVHTVYGGIDALERKHESSEGSQVGQGVSGAGMGAQLNSRLGLINGNSGL